MGFDLNFGSGMPDGQQLDYPGAQPPQPWAPQPAGVQPLPPPGQGNPALDPMMAQAMLALHGQAGKRQQISRQQKLADQLRADSSDLMRTKQAGRVTVGPKWYDALANVAGNAEAMREDLATQEQSGKLDEDYTSTVGNFINDYKRKSLMNQMGKKYAA